MLLRCYYDYCQQAAWTGSLTPSTTASYTFNCSFLGGYGIAWVDGHLLCTHGMPLYARDIGKCKACTLLNLPAHCCTTTALHGTA